MFYKVPEQFINSVSGCWGVHRLQPRLSIHGWGILPENCLMVASIPQEIKDIVSGFELIDFNAEDFPVPEVVESVPNEDDGGNYE